MKSAHRHQLETNWLAQRLDVAIERFRPYASTVAGVIVAIVVLMMVWSYVSGSSAARHEEAWDGFNQAVGSVPPNLNELHQAAQEYPGSDLQQLADATWADGQVFFAAENYLYNRSAAMESLDRATSTYQSILQTSDDERLVNRAHLGMARVYEMRNELDKARDEYLKVTGGYAKYAELQAERLADPESKDTYAWLAKAEPPRLRAPAGPGTPGKEPDFSVGDLSLPAEGQDVGLPSSTAAPGESFEDLLKGLRDLPTESGERYETEQQSPPTDLGAPLTPSESTPPAPEETPAEPDEKPAE
jgi:hypothetical protein